MKKEIIFITILFTLISGCAKQPVVIDEPGDSEQNTNGQLGQDVEIKSDDSSDWRLCKNKNIGLQLKYPMDWNECKILGNQFSFQTSVDFDEKYLIILFEKYDNIPAHISDMLKNNNLEILENGSVKVFKVPGFAGTVDNYGVITENDFYLVGSNVEDKLFEKKSVFDNSSGGWDIPQLEYEWKIIKSLESIK